MMEALMDGHPNFGRYNIIPSPLFVARYIKTGSKND